jgi:hypothetical protein
VIGLNVSALSHGLAFRIDHTSDHFVHWRFIYAASGPFLRRCVFVVKIGL